MDFMPTQIRTLEKIADEDQLDEFFKQTAAAMDYVSCALVVNSDKIGEDLEPGERTEVFGKCSKHMMRWLGASINRLLQVTDKGACPLMTRNLARGSHAPNGLVLCFTHGAGKKSLIVLEFDAQTDHQTMESVGWYWMIVGQYALAALNRCHAKYEVKFTKREVECLQWVSKGKTSWEVSIILGVSERTVNFHIQNCMKKTRSVNRQQVISKCMVGGII